MTDGWEEEDDLDHLLFDNDNNNQQKNDHCNMNEEQKDETNESSILKDGWGDEDDFFREEDDDEDDMYNNRHVTETIQPIISNRLGTINTETNIHSLTTTINDNKKDTIIPVDGWDDNDDDLDWDVEQDDSSDNHHYNTITTTTNNNNNNNTKQYSSLQHNIQQYIEQLEFLSSSLNAVLQSEYNTPEKAYELLEYYRQRPQLRMYTLEKELNRMDYTVVTNDGDVITDKMEIKQLLLEDDALKSVVTHCANQSLLADLLQVCTGPDVLIRPQFLAATTTQQVHFRLDLGADIVQAHATLVLSLPTDHGRWDIATIVVQVVFCCCASSYDDDDNENPFVEYRIHSIHRMSSSTDESSLHSCVEFLLNMELHDNELSTPFTINDNMNTSTNTTTNNMSKSKSTTTTNFRDMFVQQVWSNSTTGFQSALAEMDSVTGLSQKLQQLPRFLPENIVEAAIELEQQQEQHDDHTPTPIQRPTSILGGLVRTGFTKLAQSVVLPEEDPSMYQDMIQRTTATTSTKEIGQLKSSSIPTLHRPPTNPLDRLVYHQQQEQPTVHHNPPPIMKSSQGRPDISTTINPLDRLVQHQQQQQQSAVHHGPPPMMNPLDRLVHAQPSTTTKSSSVIHPQSQSHSHIPNINPLDRLAQQVQQSSSSQMSHNRNHPLDRLTHIHPHSSNNTGSTKHWHSPKDTSTSNMFHPNEKEDGDENELLKDGWEDDDDALDLDDGFDDTNVVTSSQPILSEYAPRNEEEVPPGYQYNPEDDIIPCRKRWIDPQPGIRIGRPVR